MDLLLVFGQEVDGVNLGFETLGFTSEDVCLGLGKVVHITWVRDLLLHFFLGCWSLDLTLSLTSDPVFLHSVHVLHIKVATGSVFLVRVESSNVGIAVRVTNDTRSVHLVILELALIDGTIFEDDLASLHLVVLECTFKCLFDLTINIFTFAMELAVDKITFVFNFTSFGREYTLSGLFAFFEVSNVLVFSPLPLFRAFALLDIVFPIAIVNYSCFFLDEDALSIGHTVLPCTLV